jgi:hypothetical protein
MFYFTFNTMFLSIELWASKLHHQLHNEILTWINTFLWHNEWWNNEWNIRSLFNKILEICKSVFHFTKWKTKSKATGEGLMLILLLCPICKLNVLIFRVFSIPCFVVLSFKLHHWNWNCISYGLFKSSTLLYH